MKNLIKKILKEEVASIEIDRTFQDFQENFQTSFSKKLQNSDVVLEELIQDIKKSPTPKMTISERGAFCGMSLNNNVLLSSGIFYKNIYEFIFILFHEIAHQYQYKKYGRDILYRLTTQEITDQTLNSLLEIEQVADRFGEMMAAKYANKFGLTPTKLFSPYKGGGGKESYRRLLTTIQKEIEEGKITCVEEMESFMTDYLVTPKYTPYTGMTSYPQYRGSSYDYGYGDRPYYDYRGSSYGYGYGRPSYGYDDDFYEKEYQKYEKQHSSNDSDGEENDIAKEYKPLLDDLKNDIAFKIHEVFDDIHNEYGSKGVNMFMELLDDEGFENLYYGYDVEIDDIGSDMEEDELKDSIEDIFHDFMMDMHEFIGDRIGEMMDDIEKDYGWEGEHVFISLLDDEGLGKLWTNF